MTAMRAVGVVVPAHDEQELLPRCLDALAVAAARVAADVAVQVVIALDACSDGSAAVVAARPWIESVTIAAASVGAARRAGVEAVLARTLAVPRELLWLATTDADSIVPADWLERQLGFATAGWEVVVGTVEVDDFSAHAVEVATRWHRSYRPVTDHGHVHGANLGCTAAAYVDAGGWSAIDCGEDVALVAALAHRRMLRTPLLPVITSGRDDPRAMGGFGDHLRGLAG
jgi:glycosyltransferase involved in cell wall biosynthesis